MESVDVYVCNIYIYTLEVVANHCQNGGQRLPGYIYIL